MTRKEAFKILIEYARENGEVKQNTDVNEKIYDGYSIRDINEYVDMLREENGQYYGQPIKYIKKRERI